MSYFMDLVLKSSSFLQDTEEYLQKHLREKKIHGSKESKGSKRGDTERKQVIPVNRGNTQWKCINVTDESKKKSICTMEKNKESLLAKIKLMTSEQRDILSDDFFNQEVERLKGRIEQVECIRTHEDIVKTSLKKVSELEKDINAILALREEATPTVAVPQSYWAFFAPERQAAHAKAFQDAEGMKMELDDLSLILETVPKRLCT